MAAINQSVGLAGDSASVLSGGTQGVGGPGAAVDSTFQAPRFSYRPADHATLGHFSVAQRSGELVATIGAAGHLARFRWTDATRFALIHRIKVGWSISGAVTTAVEMTLRAIIARAFTVDFTTARTLAAMGVVANTGKMRNSMATSLLGANGPAIATTTVMSGQTLTADADPFAIAPMPSLAPVTATGTAVAIPVGAASPMITLYENTSLNQHPLILGANEGVIIQPHLAGPGSGTWALYVQWEWAELVAY